MNWIFSKTYKGTERLDGKTVIITGSNCGIGKETAQEFYRRGAKVIMACRDIQKAERAVIDIKQLFNHLPDVGEFVVVKLDLASFEQVRKCAEEILRTEPVIHMLVNNAGVATYSKELSEDGYELNFAVNHLGHFLFTLLLLPRIIKSAPARIIMISSMLHSFCDGKMHFEDINLDEHNFFSLTAYGRSKLANILFAMELGKRLQGTGVTTYSLHPGVVDTDINRHWCEEQPLLTRLFMKICRLFIKTPVQGIQTILHCSLNERCGHETGLFYKECAPNTPSVGRNCEEKCRQLWEESLKIVKLSNFNPFSAS